MIRRDAVARKRKRPPGRVIRHPDHVPGLGLVPDTAKLLAVVDTEWDDDLEAAWPAKQVEPWFVDLDSPPRVTARHAVCELVKAWRRNAGPEYAAEHGVDLTTIVEIYARTPRGTLDELDLLGPPTVDDVRGWLRDGSLLHWYLTGGDWPEDA